MAPQFVTTEWSQVLAARDGSESVARRALEGLCEAYWYPLYAYVRRAGYDPESAGDLTQGFFTELIEKDGLQSISQSKGRFRSFLLGALRHYLSHERDRERAQKRGGGTWTLSLDADAAEGRFRREPADPDNPETLYERRWALTTMERAMARLGQESAERGGGLPFDRLKLYLTGSTPSVPYAALASELGTSEGAVKSSVYRLRRRYGELLRDEVAATVAERGAVDDELRHLLSSLRP